MEDLGNINITIRETGGGRGASGNVGGGPQGKEPPTAKEVAEAVQAGETEQERIKRRAAEPTPPLAIFQKLDRTIGRQQIGSELMDFMRRPSFANATGLIREGTATRGMLEGLGKMGVKLGGALLAVGAAAGGVALALGALKMASDHVASRIEETWRYSVQQAGAVAEQQVMRVMMLAQEAARNGKLYADVIRSQTAVEVERAKMNMQLGRVTAKLTVQFNRFLEEFFKFADKYIGVASSIIEKAQEAAEYAPIVAAARYGASWYERNISNVEGSGLNLYQSMRLALLDAQGDVEGYNKLQNEYMEEIARNTRKDAMTEANEWFQADIQYLTGSRF